MPVPKAPSKVENIPFPVFGCTWYGSPALPPKNRGCSILAYCGGGGSAKTGVFNKISLSITSTFTEGEEEESAGSVVTTQHVIEIDTKEELCVGVHLFDGGAILGSGKVFLLAAVGDKVLLYSIPLQPPEVEEGEEETKSDGSELLLGSANVGKLYGTNVISFTPLGSMVAVGCENGHVVLLQMERQEDNSVTFHKIADCEGHTKAVCTISFHPRGTHVLTSAKDGTARLWSLETQKETQVLTCDISDPDAPPPKNARRPPQVLVRGSAFGDLEGKIIYTVASGRRGGAFLTKWVGTPDRSKVQPPLSDGPPGGAPPKFIPPTFVYNPTHRMKCSPVPVSAMSLSGDATTLALGGVEGAISLLNVESMKIVKIWPGVHDLPVTGIAARPVPLPLPGEGVDDEDGGVCYDAVSASADNRLAKVTLQKYPKRRKKKTRSSYRKPSKGMSTMDWLVSFVFMLVLALMYVVIQQSLEFCEGPLEVMNLEEAYECVVHTVLWAESDRPGIRSVPY
mmetsp:Transcript_10368/g.13889  ORF Transcript_10368/g.13889 Transcript_10368/m.13889 type:complete len:510 (-) Transcript_10368:517-2046(-)